MAKQNKHIRLEDWLLNDVDTFAGKHKFKNDDGSFNFTEALHNRYRELLEIENKFGAIQKDITTWKAWAENQKNTKAVYCEMMKEEITPAECKICSDRRLISRCPKTKPLEKPTSEPLPVGRVEQGGVHI